MRRRVIVLFITGLVIAPLHGQSFEDFLERVQKIPRNERPVLVERALTDYPLSPIIINDTTVALTYSGPARSVTLAGDANAWDPRRDSLRMIDGTDFWYTVVSFPSDARLDYKFVLDGQAWILDPRNPHSSLGGYGRNSELRMPAYDPPDEIVAVATVPSGSLIDTTVRSIALEDDRSVSIYVPAHSYTAANAGLVVVHDGQDFISFADMPVVLDNLIAQGRIPPTIAVFLPPKEREREYDGERIDDHAAFVATEVVPMIRRRFGLTPDPARTVVLGASSGGNISLSVAVQYPEIFGNVAAFSSNVIPRLAERFARSERLPLRIYLDIGTFDIAVLISRVSDLRDILLEKGYPTLYVEHHDGHSFANWRAHLDDALIFLFSR